MSKAIKYIRENKLIQDSTNLLEDTEQMRNSISYRSSILDPLTKLHTRWYYTQRLEEEFEKSQRLGSSLSSIMGDIDDFKKINDGFGHKVGDEVLIAVAKTLKDLTRKYDVVGRYGGEEFVVILPDTGEENAFAIAERMRESIQNLSIFPFKVTMSFGVSSTESERFEKHQDLIVAADKAMYYSKNRGKNLVSRSSKIGG